MVKLCFTDSHNKFIYNDIPQWILERYGNKRRYGYYIKMPRDRFGQLLMCDQIYFPDGLVEVINLDEFPPEAKTKLIKRSDGAYDCPISREEMAI